MSQVLTAREFYAQEDKPYCDTHDDYMNFAERYAAYAVEFLIDEAVKNLDFD